MMDQMQFREAMSRLGAAVTIITTDGPLGRHGFTASAVCSVTDQPPTILVCMNRSVSSHEAIIRNGIVGINVLASVHKKLSASFADRKVDMVSRFAGHDWQTSANGVPLLDGAVVGLGCAITSSVEVGTHTILICEIVDVRLGEGIADALLWCGRAYHSLPLREPVAV